jgi:hypothetical protein
MDKKVFRRARDIQRGVEAAEADRERRIKRKADWDDKEDVREYRRRLRDEKRAAAVLAVGGKCPECGNGSLNWVIRRGKVVRCKRCDQRRKLGLKGRGGDIKANLFVQVQQVKVEIRDLLGQSWEWWCKTLDCSAGEFKTWCNGGKWVDEGTVSLGTVVDRRVMYLMDVKTWVKVRGMLKLGVKAMARAVGVAHTTVLSWEQKPAVWMTAENSHKIWAGIKEAGILTGDPWWC